MVIKGVLKEELQNSQSIKKEYERELAKLPKGCLVKKNIKGHHYYYVAKREGQKVVFVYQKNISGKEIKRYQDAKRRRKKYRKLISELNDEIKFIRRALRG
ncbi:MAG: hypothetical protein ISS33_02545 [Candidatus Omnitrophica bacterium]|nr:hypothetical protein [Candidatus Omnitrophota bacterium]